MSLFMAVFFIATTLEFGPLMLVGLVIWFYSFFHVHNLASLPDEEFYSVEDDYILHFNGALQPEKIFSPKYRQLFAGVMIFTGVVVVWQTIIDLLYHYLPQEIYDYLWHLAHSLPKCIAGIAIILIGIVMIHGKKKELDQMEEKNKEL